MTFSAGNKLTAAQLNVLANPITGRADRGTSGTTTTTTEKTYLRLDSIPIVSGELYEIETTPMIFESSVAGDIVQVFLRASTSGAATTASTQLTILCDDAKTASSFQKTKGLYFPYVATTTGSLSLLLSYKRASGTGNVRINASSDIPVVMTVRRSGVPASDTGVDL